MKTVLGLLAHHRQKRAMEPNPASCHWLRAVLLIVFCAVLLGQWGEAKAQVQYVYDAAGRLTVVYAPNGDAAQYVYDPAGNITQINRFTASNLSVIEFSPLSGPIGATVTVYGTGFNATPAANTVKFNGTIANVSSGTTSQLVVTVPSGATTGPISVTNGANTATSARNFTITQPVSPPTITGFTPTIGPVGTTVTINGTNFDPIPANDVARFNQRISTVLAATPTALTTSVSNSASSGKISVTTPAGTATSVDDFFVPPSPYTASSVGATGRLTVDGAALSVNLATAGKIALVVFDANRGDLLDLQFSNVVASAGSVSYTLYSPTSAVVKTGTFTSLALTALLPELPATGTYTLLINPGTTGTASFSVAVKSVATLPIDGASVNATTGTGQSLRFKFTGAAGQNLGLALTGLTHTPASGNQTLLTVYKPDATQLTTTTCYTSSVNGGCPMTLANLPQSGTYWVVMSPPSGVSASATLTLSSDVTGTLAISAAQTVNLARAGQNGRFTFSGMAGQVLALEMAQLSIAPTQASAFMYVYKPDGSALTSTSANTYGAMLRLILPSTGTYTVFLNTNYGATANFRLTLYVPEALSIDGSALNVTTATGVGHAVSFVGSIGQNLGLALTSLTHSPVNNTSTSLSVYRPDGAALTSTSCYTTLGNGGCSLTLANLPQAGTYLVVMSPPPGVSASASMTLSNDVVGTLALNTSQTVSLARAGQNGRFTFSGTAGQVLALQMAQLTIAPSQASIAMYVYKPDGTTLTSVSTSSYGAMLRLTLPSSGTYTVFLSTLYGGTASFTLTLYPPESISIDGSALSVTTETGVARAATFVGSVGQNLGLALTGLTHNPANSNPTSLSVYRPDGAALTSTSCYTGYGNGGCSVTLANLPQAGTYWVVMSPPSGVSANATLTLSSDVTGTLASNAPQAVSLARAGQNGRFTFSGTAGQVLALEMAQLTIAPSQASISMYVYKPDGTTLTSASTSTYGSMLRLTLPSTGTYTVFLSTIYGATASFTLTLYPPDTLAIDGSALNVTTATGVAHALSFVGSVGQNLGLAVTGLTHSPANSNQTSLMVYKPDGSQLASATCYPSNPGGGCSLTLANLPQAGTYLVVVSPPSGASASAAVTLSTDVTGTLALGTPQSVNLARAGQNGRFTFSGTAGQALALEMAQLSMVPSQALMSIYVYKPDGTTLTSASTNSYGSMLRLTPPSTGTYTVFMYANYAATASFTLTLYPPDALSIDGSALNVTTATGVAHAAAFVGSVGQNLGLALTGLTHSPANSNYTALTVYKPDGSQLNSGICYTTNPGGGCSLNLTNLPQAGTYWVVMAPPVGVSATATLTLSSDLTGTLANNTPQSVSIARSGQNARLTFSGVVGEVAAVTLSGLSTVPINQTVTVTAYKPDGTQLVSTTSTTTGATLNLGTLAVTGTYTVFIDQLYGATASMTVNKTP